jgi:hypothetical protein
VESYMAVQAESGFWILNDAHLEIARIPGAIRDYK